MDLTDSGFDESLADFRPIPPELHSVYDCRPFSRCTICSGSLDCVYELQKVFRGSEVLFEMAICRQCGEQVAKEFSKESIEAMKGFLLSNFRPHEETSHCHFCGFPRELLSGWTTLGACRNEQLIFPLIVVCETCSESLQERLSKATRDLQDEFIRDHFPGVPENIDFSPSVFGG